MEGTVIVADDDKSIRTVVAQALTRAGCRVKSTGTITTLWRWIEEGEGDVVVTDVMMPDGDALDILPVLKKKRADLSIIVMSAHNNVMTAIRATKSGAYEYLPKPFDLKDLLSLVNKALNKKGGRLPTPNNISNDPVSETIEEELPLIGRSTVMQEVYRIMARLMNTDLSVLITGNSGTGKEIVSRTLHNLGHRRDFPFVAINLASIPTNSVESELFGIDPKENSNETIIGKFEQANNGTLFLDEIGDIPLGAQKSLLRVLQEGEFSRIGGNKKIKSNVRIISATHQDLRSLINEGKFREDLFYRLNVVPVKLPELRDRLDDIRDLTTHFLRLADLDGLGLKTFSKESVELLKKQSWPGNVRELENFIRRLVVLSTDDEINVTAVARELEVNPSSQVSKVHTGNQEQLSVSVEQHLKRYFDLHGDNLPPAGLYDRVIKEIELPLLALALSATRGNQVKTANLLGINRNTLRKKIKELEINVSRGKKMM